MPTHEPGGREWLALELEHTTGQIHHLVDRCAQQWTLGPDDPSRADLAALLTAMRLLDGIGRSLAPDMYRTAEARGGALDAGGRAGDDHQVPYPPRYAAIIDGAVWGVGDTPGAAMAAYQARMDRLHVPPEHRVGPAPLVVRVAVQGAPGDAQQAWEALDLDMGGADRETGG